MIRQLQSRRIPIIAMTAQAMIGDRERILNAGLDAYVAKPIDMRLMLATLKEVLGIRSDAESKAVQQEEKRADSDPNVLDFAAFQRLCDDDIDLVNEIAMLFSKTCEETMAVIVQGIAEKDLERVEKAAHKLKSSVGNMCASRALEAAQRVEAAARGADLEKTRDCFTELTREIRFLRQALADVKST
jgi:CheY-like chemotaxis protein